jgi:large subunit ribosomal protein L17
MRHRKAGRLFSRTANQRKALLRSLVGALIEHERIETTVAKAKEARRLAERLVSLALRGDLHARRLALSRLPNKALVEKLFKEIAPRFRGRAGGYLRLVHTRQRLHDRAQMAVLEFVDYTPRPRKKKQQQEAGS